MRAFIALILLVFVGQTWGQSPTDIWLEDPDKREFFAQHGWVYQAEGKTEGLELIAVQNPTTLNPVALGWTPLMDKPRQFAIASGGVVQVHSHERLLVLYQRWIANDRKGL